MTEQVLARVLDSMSIPLFTIDRRHAVVHWNRACESLTGMAARDMVGTPRAWVAFYPQERPVVADLIVDRRPREEIAAAYGGTCLESATHPGAYELEAYFQHLGDGGKWLFCTATALCDSTGELVGAIETFQDVTKRKQVEAELHRRVDELSEAKRRLEVLVSNVTDREKRMVHLKQEVNDLLAALGRQPKYDVPRQVAELTRATRAPAAG